MIYVVIVSIQNLNGIGYILPIWLTTEENR